MARRRRRVRRHRRIVRRRATRRRASTRNKIAGYTRVGKSYALVYRRKGKPALGKSRYRSKAALIKAARRLLRK